MPSCFEEIGMIDMMTDLDCSEDSPLINEKIEVRRNQSSRSEKISLYQFEKFFESISDKEPPGYSRQGFETPPLLDHIQVGLFV